MIPVHLLKKETKLPKDGMYYIVSKGGLFLRKETPAYDAVCAINTLKASVLENLEASVSWKLPAIPASLVWKVLKFFRQVHSKYQSEAVVLIFHKQDTETGVNNFMIMAPKQTVSAAAAKYTPLPSPSGYVLLGTIHSHSSMGAFHSGTDIRDEENSDGLHITFGNMGSETFSIVSSVVVNSQRFIIDNKRVLDGIIEREATTSYLAASADHYVPDNLEEYGKVVVSDTWMGAVKKTVYFFPTMVWDVVAQCFVRKTNPNETSLNENPEEKNEETEVINIEDALKDKSSLLSTDCSKLISTMGKENIDTLLEILSKHADFYSRKSAAEKLGELHKEICSTRIKNVIDALVSTLSTDDDNWPRECAISSLKDITVTLKETLEAERITKICEALETARNSSTYLTAAVAARVALRELEDLGLHKQ